ncbi:hypothetical protein ACFXJ5_29975 [Streptomyces sp. NPDC059373]
MGDFLPFLVFVGCLGVALGLAQAERKVPMPSPDDPLGWSRGESRDPADRRPLRPHPRRPRLDLRRRVARLWRGR